MRSSEFSFTLHVPSIGLVVAGDAAYNDVHLYLAESNAQKRQQWIAALDKIESLNPRAVVASHKRPENDDNPRIIEEMRQYIRDFDRLAQATKTAQELRIEPGTLDNWDPAMTDRLPADRDIILFDNAAVGGSTGKVPTTKAGMIRKLELERLSLTSSLASHSP